MKGFLTTTKGKVVAGIITIVVVGAIIVGFMLNNSGYRTIAVEDLNGTTTVENNGSKADAYIGQHLESGDDVNVLEKSDLTLALDTDKYVYAKELTHFWIEASGKEGDTRTDIHLAEGSTICRIDNKLGDAENFDVDTSNATMSVRGTVFGVDCFIDAEDTYTVVDVYEGEVFVQVKLENGQNTDQSRLLKAGERAVIHSNKDISEFVEVARGVEGIAYHELTQNQALFLGRAIDDGRILSIEKELLYDIVEINKHDFSEKGETVEATCEEEGYYYDVCAVCGVQGEKHIIEKLPHEYKVNADGTEERVCSVCGQKAISDEKAEVTPEATPLVDSQTDAGNKTATEVKPTATPDPVKVDPCANGHKYKVSITEATCTTNGIRYDICENCGFTATESIPATGHSYTSSSADPTCDSDGYNAEYCSRCGDGHSDTIPALGHDWVPFNAPAGGSSGQMCLRCGTIQ